MEKEELRVVWNLTNKCPFQCAICAASANKREVKDVDKFKILDSLLSVNAIHIDFSGGDPLFDRGDYEIIRKASMQISPNFISVSSTGFSLANYSDPELMEISNSYDLTYDFPVLYNHLDKRDVRYNYFNLEQGYRIKSLGLSLNIFIPLQDMDDIIIQQLANDLCILNPDSISLMRLMPVGECSFSSVTFDEVKMYNKFVSFLSDYKGIIKPTCSLRTKLGIEKGCNMFSEKYGVDHLGNLFSCIWASDIGVENNPFYVGNLLNSSFSNILKSSKESFNFKKNKCLVYHYLSTKR